MVQVHIFFFFIEYARYSVRIYGIRIVFFFYVVPYETAKQEAHKLISIYKYCSCYCSLAVSDVAFPMTVLNRGTKTFFFFFFLFKKKSISFFKFVASQIYNVDVTYTTFNVPFIKLPYL